MSAAITAAAITTAGSIYAGSKAEKAAKEAMEGYDSSMAGVLDVAEELKGRQERMIDAPLRAKIDELSGEKLTAAGQQTMDRYIYDMDKLDRDLEADVSNVGEGVTGSRQLTSMFERAKGIGNINLSDQAAKDKQLASFINLASATPAYASITAQAYSDMAQNKTAQAGAASGQAGSAFGSAAQGLGSLMGGIGSMFGG